MRNAAASFDDDMGFDQPNRKAAPRKPRVAGKTSNKKKRKGGRFAFDMHKVARYAAVGMSAMLALGIMVNALVLQKSRHPAPLFGKAIQLGTGNPPAIQNAPAPTAQAEAAPIERVPDPPIPAPKRHAAATSGASDRQGEHDAIAKLLQAPGVAASKSPEKSDAKTIMGVQRALVKLGFVLKPNGTMGPMTRKAIETFEKDRNLPVKGELNGRLIKIISAESGVKID